MNIHKETTENKSPIHGKNIYTYKVSLGFNDYFRKNG